MPSTGSSSSRQTYIASLDVTAIIGFNDHLALMLSDSLETQGVKVPVDISLIGIENSSAALVQGQDFTQVVTHRAA